MNSKKTITVLKVYFFFMLISLLLEFTSNDIKEAINIRTSFVFGIIKLVIYIILILKSVNYLKVNLTHFLKFKSLYLLFVFILTIIAFFNTHIIIIQKHYDVSVIKHILFTSFSLLIGLYEESLFRLILFYLILNTFLKYTSNTLFKSILITSLLFSLAHIQNLFSWSDIFSLINQIILAFCLAIILQVILIRTKNIFTVVFIHGMIDYYGMRNSELFKINPQANTVFTLTEDLINSFTFTLIALFLTFLCYRFCKKQYQRAEVFREQEVIST